MYKRHTYPQWVKMMNNMQYCLGPCLAQLIAALQFTLFC